MSGGSAIGRLLRLSRTVSLPSVKQGTTLSFRSRIPTALTIQSAWRDDGAVTLLHSLPTGSSKKVPLVNLAVDQADDQVTSLGRTASHVSISLHQPQQDENYLPSALDGSLLDAIDLKVHDKSNPLEMKDKDGVVSQVWVEEEGNERASIVELTLDVPEKVNLVCELEHGGSIDVTNKIEGDVKLKTVGGNVRVKKLRGHSIQLETTSHDAYIHASDLLEAQKLSINLSGGGRFRSKRIHGETVDIQVVATQQQSLSTAQPPNNLLHVFEQLDDDDEGSLVDISSMYVSGTGGAHVTLQGPLQPTKRAVRIKSHHGPVLVQSSGVHRPCDEHQPLVELGSVNGSCEVAIQDVAPSSNNNEDPDDWVACRVHYDSISPESVSLITTQLGNVGLTFDRKMEADLRLLSSKDATTLADMATRLADEEDPELTVAGNKSSDGDPTRISITLVLTKSHSHVVSSADQQHQLEYVEGWVENKSHEPDSRFEMKTRSPKDWVRSGWMERQSSAPKLFGPTEEEEDGVTTSDDKTTMGGARPLIVAATVGQISVETLSWLGAIARRYGLDEKGRDLGRQATRRGRVVLPADE
ncbi:expressed unknown protein [Seminavis robusta]|uniref:Adhesin domain-containing protein n=1 Tax=Seminavis robusta TaxID=568900 RepID=A0A9N8H9G1_9STRA|nr:expressed unknown protein [Seminavis robusta]|eukprot:Sro253_g099890.1 n/a (584) ;mRNA; f:41643-43394